MGVQEVDVIKIDVEGWELSVLAGLERTIKRSKRVAIFCEYSPGAQQCAGHSGADLFNWFVTNGFAVSSPGDHGLERISAGSLAQLNEKLGAKGYTTLFALRDDGRDGKFA